MIQNLFKTKKIIIIFTAIVVLSFFYQTVFAVWSGTFYEPGDTLNPECLPTDVDCNVRSPLTAINIDDTAYGASWDTDTTHAPSKNAVYDKIEGLVAGSHDVLTLGTANELSLVAQVLSLALASTSTTGALSDTDWNTFNNKQSALTADVDYLSPGTATSTYVPYTGATTNLNLGNFTLTTPSILSPIGTTLALSSTAPTATTGASQAGIPLTLTSSNAVASTDTAGAAAGGNVTITAGNAARLTSGSAVGGNLNLYAGTGIGGGANGSIDFGGGLKLVEYDGTGWYRYLYAVSPITRFDINAGGAQFILSGNAYTFNVGGNGPFYVDSTKASLSNVTALGWSSGFAGTQDISLRRIGAANPGWGLASATPVAYTHSLSADGSGTNIVGANATIQPGMGTGSATPSNLYFSTADVLASGTTLQTATPKMTIGTGVIANKNFEAWGTGTYASGNVQIGNSAVADGNNADYGSIAIGKNASANNASAIASIAIGSQSISTGGSSIALGSVANASASGAISIGTNSVSSANGSIALGNSASATGTSSTAIGGSATANYAVAIGGYGAASAYASSVAIGTFATTTAARQMVLGGNDATTNFGIQEIYLGSGVTQAAPGGVTVLATGGSGTDIAGASLTLAGGKGTGNGNGGSVIIQTSPALASGTTLQTLQTLATFEGGTNGNIIFNPAGTGTVQAWGQGDYPSASVQIGVGSQAWAQGDAGLNRGSVAIGRNAVAGTVSDVGGAVAIGVSAVAAQSSVAIGRSATVGGGGSGVAIGVSSLAGESSIAIGGSTGSTNMYALALGGTATGARASAIGLSSSATFNYSIALGSASATTAVNQLVVGSGNTLSQITDGYFGSGVVDDTPYGFTLNATGGSGTNIAGASLTLAGGKGTGNALGGSLIFSTSDAGSTGTTLQTLTPKMTILGSGNVGISNNTPGNLLSVGTPTTADALADVMIGTSATTQKGLVIQGKASQTANLQEWQGSDGTIYARINSAGNISGAGNATNYANAVEHFGQASVGTGVYGLAVGYAANSGSVTGATAIGASSSNTGLASVALGYSATAGANGVALGSASVATADQSIAIGKSATTATFADSVAIGYGVTTTATNQLVFGGYLTGLTTSYFGNGVTNATPSGHVFNATGGSGTNIAGASLTLAGGKGTGNALGGSLIFSTSDAGASGTTLQSLTPKMTILPSGNVGIGTATPGALLNVKSSTATVPGVIIQTSDDSTAQPMLQLKRADGTSAFEFVYSATTPALKFYSYTGAGGSATLSFDKNNNKINSSVSLGIGGLTVSGTSIDSNGWQAIKTTGGSGGYISFSTETSSNERMRIASTGNVGIGIAAPTSRIHGVTTLSAATGDEVAYSLDYTTNKATSGADTGLLINMTDTASPGTSLPLDIKVGGTSKFSVNSIGTVTAGTVSPTSIFFGGTAAIYTQGNTNWPTIGSNGTGWVVRGQLSTAAATLLNVTGSTFINTSGSAIPLSIATTYNQASGTAANTDLLINRTETAVGSGTQRLIDAQVGGVSKFSVSNAGAIQQAGCTTAGTLSADVSGNIICTPSSERFKDNVNNLDDSLSNIMALRPVSYNFNSSINMGSGTYFGFISEEVALISSQFATHDKQGAPYGLDTNAILASTIKAIQEMNLSLEDISSLIPSPLQGEGAGGEVSFFSRLLSKLTTWLADAGNGIKNIFVEKVETKEICVSDDSGAKTCITKIQLDALLLNAGTSSAPEPTPTPEPAEEPTPAEPENLTPSPSPSEELGEGGSIETGEVVEEPASEETITTPPPSSDEGTPPPQGGEDTTSPEETMTETQAETTTEPEVIPEPIP